MGTYRSAAVLAILAASLSVMLSTGIRQSFGLLLEPITGALGTGRESFSLAIALSNLIYGLPLVGLVADRLGSRRVLMGGALCYALGMVLLTRITSTAGLLLTLGVLVGLALSATTYVVVLGAVGQLVAAEQRSRVFGVITATGSSGMFVVPPLAQMLVSGLGWQQAVLILAGVSGLIVFLGLGLPARPSPSSDTLGERTEEPLGGLLRRASRHSGYRLLVTGFFVCGFHVAFISTHLPAYLTDNGIPAFAGAVALSLVGAFNMVGSLLFGWLGDHLRKRYLLSGIYAGRALVIGLFLLLPLSATSAFVFSAAMGTLWLATVPLTSGTVAQIFGVRYLSTLYGIVFFSHQVGAFLGVWLGGRLYDAMGTYDPVWYTAVALGLVAALIHLPLADRPAPRTEAAGLTKGVGP